MAVKNPRVGDERRRCRETVLVERTRVRRSERENEFISFRSMPVGSWVASVRSVSVTQAIRLRIHLTEPARALITSG